MYVNPNYSAEEKTWICPDDDGEELSNEGEQEKGAPMRWIVRNQSSGSVIISWLSNDGGVSVEASAINPKIIPAHHDPNAILKPGEYHSMQTFQGHLFQVREALVIGGEIVSGRVLLRHRTGLIPVRNRLAKDTASCPASAITDPDPHANKPITTSLRTPPSVYKRCNALSIGFTNKVGCPIDLYWAGTGAGAGSGAGLDDDSSNRSSPTTGSANNDSSGENNAHGANCHEQFKSHLGVNPHPINLDEWSSQTKYESTYLSHRYVARLRHDPSIVVDDITIQPATVRDCPSRKTRHSVGSSGVGDAISVSMEVPEDSAKATPIVVSATKSLFSSLGTNSSTTMDGVVSPKNLTALVPNVGCDSSSKARNCGASHSIFGESSLGARIISRSYRSS